MGTSIKNQRSKFSLPSGVTYLNCAYMSPLLKSVEKAGIAGMARKRNPFSISANDFFTGAELLRKEFATLIGAADSRRIAIIPSVSYGLANVAKNIRLHPGDKVVLVAEQFPSNYYPWQRLAAETKSKLQFVEAPEGSMSRGKEWNERILEAIDPTTKIVALGNVHWADGTRFDLLQIRKRCNDVGSKLIIDGTQSVGALPFDLTRIKPDALVCAGYKWLMGPYSIGLAYYNESFDNGIPIEENWINRKLSEDFAGLVQYNNDYQSGALRYEVGERSNFILVPMMMEALKKINSWQPERIQSYCKAISSNGIERLREAGFWIEDEKFRGQHLFGIRPPKGKLIDTVREKLKRKKISVSVRGNSLRVSPNVYNSQADFEKLVKVLLD